MFTNAMNQAAGTTGEAAKSFMEKSESADSYINAKDAIQMLMDSGRQGQKNAGMLNNLLTKAVGVGDIGAVRLVSLDTQQTKLYDPTTVFYNLHVGARRNTVSDFTHGFTEEDWGPASLDSMVFNPNLAPAEDNGPRNRRTNTLSAIGTQVSVGIVSAEMIKKRGFVDELDRQLTDAQAKLRKATNRQLLVATEDAAGPIFKMGGLSSRITTNVTAMGGGNVTAAAIDAEIKKIVEVTGLRSLRIMAGAKQIAVIHGFLLSQFPGARVEDWSKTHEVTGQVLSTIYFSPLVGPIEVFLEMQLPSGELVIYDPAPQLVAMNGFTIGDQAGPWVISLAQTGMTYEPKVIFDLLTLEDRHEKTRAKLTGLATA